ncbi:MAG TPA: tetratricopeptide repeat protein [Ignavibacteriaceae bacterium]|nr:tetratricopeptide repeat protein [Ignavibacteriaceae bacterium]
MIFRNNTSKFTTILFLLLFLSGCSVWDNFTTYFNLYYNTATLFEDAETEILSQKRDLFSNDPLVISGTAKTSLIKVVEKSSKLLQFNASSAYVDEALIMLGKSFYYQGNYQKSKRKFEELLATDIDDDEIITEANLWIAKNNFELRENTQALKLLEEVRTKSVEEDYDYIIKDSYIQEIKYRLREKDYPKAIALANEFADAYDNDQTRAQIYFELGNLYTLIKENDNAILAYEKVFNYSPDFDLEIITTIKYADALRNGGQTQKALDVFEDIRTKDKYINSFNEIDFEIGKTLVALGEFDRAMDQFRIVDTTYKNTPFASASNFEMGELFRTKFMNYDSAGYYFSKAASSNPPKEYVDEAKSNNLLFAKYSKLRGEINKFDKQLYYSQNLEIFQKDSSEYLADSLKIMDEFLAQKEMEDIWKNVGVDTSSNQIDSSFIKDSLFVKDSLARVDSLVQIGEISAFDTTGLESRLTKFINQKRIDAINEKKNKDFLAIRNQGQVTLDSLNFKGNPPKRLSIPIDSAKSIISKNNLELGNLFLTEFNVPDSAYNFYKQNLDEYPGTNYYPNTLYAMGSYYLTVNEKQKADSLFKIIYDNYKDRSIVNAAADKLQLPLIDLKFDPAKDSYASAEDLMLSGDFRTSVSKFFNIYTNYPKSSLAPQALYASAYILENDLFLLDSAAAVYDTLIAKYPTTVYIKKISQKVTTYKQEKARIQKALQDSLNALANTQTDSTLIAVNDIDQTNPDLVSEELSESGKIDETKMPVNTANDNQSLNPNIQNIVQTKKKLEPLWDPRKHFN